MASHPITHQDEILEQIVAKMPPGTQFQAALASKKLAEAVSRNSHVTREQLRNALGRNLQLRHDLQLKEAKLDRHFESTEETSEAAKSKYLSILGRISQETGVYPNAVEARAAMRLADKIRMFPAIQSYIISKGLLRESDEMNKPFQNEVDRLSDTFCLHIHGINPRVIFLALRLVDSDDEVPSSPFRNHQKTLMLDQRSMTARGAVRDHSKRLKDFVDRLKINHDADFYDFRTPFPPVLHDRNRIRANGSRDEVSPPFWAPP